MAWRCGVVRRRAARYPRAARGYPGTPRRHDRRTYGYGHPPTAIRTRPMLTLILRVARSGRSARAERLAPDSGREVIYVATAQALDAEMDERIAHHRARRPVAWGSIEEPLALADVLREHARDDRFLLVDRLPLWLSNLLRLDDGVALTT